MQGHRLIGAGMVFAALIVTIMYISQNRDSADNTKTDENRDNTTEQSEEKKIEPQADAALSDNDTTGLLPDEHRLLSAYWYDLGDSLRKLEALQRQGVAKLWRDDVLASSVRETAPPATPIFSSSQLKPPAAIPTVSVSWQDNRQRFETLLQLQKSSVATFCQHYRLDCTSSTISLPAPDQPVTDAPALRPQSVLPALPAAPQFGERG